MPILPNPRHERFAQELATGKSADEAYQEAGYSPARQNASRLMANDTIRARVAELQQRIVDGIVLSRQWVIEELIDNVKRAKQATAVTDADGNVIGEYRYEGSVANKALELLGKEVGMFVERQERGKPGDFEKMNADELRDSIARDMEALGRKDLAAALAGGSGKPVGKPN